MQREPDRVTVSEFLSVFFPDEKETVWLRCFPAPSAFLSLLLSKS